MDINIDVNASGPVFDGLAAEEVERFAEHVEGVLGEIGVTMIKAYLPTQYMYLGHHGGSPESNPVPSNAGFLVSQVFTERASPEAVVVTETPWPMLIYGPWIEGIAPGNLIVWPHRRNPPPRRFTGYHAFRKIGQSLNAIATPIAYRELPYYIRMMNGT